MYNLAKFHILYRDTYRYISTLPNPLPTPQGLLAAVGLLPLLTPGSFLEERKKKDFDADHYKCRMMTRAATLMPSQRKPTVVPKLELCLFKFP